MLKTSILHIMCNWRVQFSFDFYPLLKLLAQRELHLYLLETPIFHNQPLVHRQIWEQLNLLVVCTLILLQGRIVGLGGVSSAISLSNESFSLELISGILYFYERKQTTESQCLPIIYVS